MRGIGIAIVLAAGKGTRMLPNTRSYPKELMEFGEKPVIEHIFSSIKDAGFKRVLMIVGHKKGAIIDYIGDGKHFGVSTEYIFQEEPKGLGHAVLSSKPVINDDFTDFLVCFGDNIIQPSSEISNLMKIHEKFKPLATIMTFETKTPEKYGVVKINSKSEEELRIVDIKEKPQTQDEQSPFMINGAFQAVSSILAFSTKIYEYIEKIPPGHGGEVQITDAIGLGIKNGETVLAYPLKGSFIDIGGWEYLRDQRRYFSEMTEEQLEEIVKERIKLMTKLKNEVDSSLL